MRKATALKTLLRSPLKTLLTFLLIAAASFALFSRITDYAVTMRETQNAKSLYHAVAFLDNEVPDRYTTLAEVYSPDKSAGRYYDLIYEIEDKPWLTKQEQEEFASLPGVTLADTSYMTAGRVENYKRLVGQGEYSGFVVFEGTYEGYKEDASTVEDHVELKFADVEVIACDGGPEIPESFMTENVPLGETSYASYTRAFYDGLTVGCRCLVLARNTGYHRENGSSGITFDPDITGEGSLRVLDGEPDNYLETESFAIQKGWVDAINHNNYAYDIEYTSDMRARGFDEYSLAEGRLLTAGDTDVCVVSEDFLKRNGLSIGDRINIQLGDVLCHGRATTHREVGAGLGLDAGKTAEYVDSAEVTIIGAYPCGYYTSPNTIYVPSALLPVEVPEDYEADASEFSVFVEDADDIEAFHEAIVQFAQKVDLKLDYSDDGWLDVKDSFEMGAFTSLLTTILYIMGAILALYLAVYLYVGRNKKTYAIMRMLGVPAGAAEGSVVLPFVAVSVLAVPVGGIVGLFYAQSAAEKALLRMTESAPEGYLPDASLPVSVAVLCLLSELLFASLTAYSFLRKMKKTPPLELLQEGIRPGRNTGLMRKGIKSGRNAGSALQEISDSSVPAKLELAKLSAAGEWQAKGNYSSVRHVISYIWRHMRRGVGKTAVSLILAFVLVAGIGTFVLARIAYRDAFHELSVTGRASGFTFSSVVELSKSPLVKDFYCQKTCNAWVQDTETDIPMTITSDMMRDLGDDCPVEYAKGYDISVFDGTGQVCIVGRELADRLGLSLGDELDMMSDFLHFILNGGAESEEAISQAYKKYKIVGIAESEEAAIRDSIFMGIRSDLQRIFSMDFDMDHCEFTLTDNNRVEELKNLLEEKVTDSLGYSENPTYVLDTGGLANIERIRGLLDALFPIAVAAAVLIGLFGPLLVILQSAQEAAFLRILGVTKKRARCMLVFEQIFLSIAGVLLVAGGLALYDPGRFFKGGETFAACFGLYFLGCVCGACAAAVQVTRGRLLELLQVKE